MDNFIDVVKEVFENPGKMTPEAIQNLILETNRYFASIDETIKSGDADAQDAALEKAIELKRFLESKMGIFAPFMGRELTADEQAALAQMNQDLQPKKTK